MKRRKECPNLQKPYMYIHIHAGIKLAVIYHQEIMDNITQRQEPKL